MGIEQIIRQRHSVRSYQDRKIEEEKIDILNKEIDRINKESNLKIELVTEDREAFNTMLAHYGKFSNAFNYFAIIGDKNEDFAEKGGYYGEQLVLLAQQLGLNTCWVALTYSKKNNKLQLKENEKLLCVISVGYGVNQGYDHKIKSFDKVTKNVQNPPEWFKRGVEFALLAPTAINQQQFCFTLQNNKVGLKRKLGPYSKIDLGIIRYHFELGAGKENFSWQE